MRQFVFVLIGILFYFNIHKQTEATLSISGSFIGLNGIRQSNPFQLRMPSCVMGLLTGYSCRTDNQNLQCNFQYGGNCAKNGSTQCPKICETCKADCKAAQRARTNCPKNCTKMCCSNS